MTANDQSRVEFPPINIHCTDIVHSVFDRSVGPCYEDFSCTYSRQHGRLYVARNALLYFSNLFGFERRLCMRMSEITAIKIYRSTSIWISMMDGEEIVFRSIVKRERVVQLVQKLLILTRPPQVTLVAAQENFDAPPPLDEVDTSPTTASRERVQSEMSREVSFDTDIVNGESHPVAGSALSSNRKLSMGELSCDSTCTETLLNAWNLEKKAVQETFTHTAVASMQLQCSLSEFYDMFLDDDATYSIPDYQQVEVGDKNISTTHWMLEDNNNYMTRSIEFTHPIPNSFGIGPSSTIATKRQRIRRFGEFGIIMQTETHVTGVPAADAFHVADGWIVQSGDSSTVTFTVLHDTVFTKRTMLKRVIQVNSASETKKWYNGYAASVSSRVNRGSRPNESALLPSRNESSGGQASQHGFKIDRSLKIMAVLILVMLVGISGCCIYLVTRIAELETHLSVLVQENHRRYQTSLLIVDESMPPDGNLHFQSCDEESTT